MTTLLPAKPVAPGPPADTSIPYGYVGRCPRCGDTTEASRPGEVACKWGRCNGTVQLQRKRESS